MFAAAGSFFADRLKRILPDPFVIAILLTFATAILAYLSSDASPVAIVGHWYDGFWKILEFGMQIVLMLTTGYAIALSSPVARCIDQLAVRIRDPAAVYVVVMFLGGVFSLVSWGWMVITAVLARELSRRVKGVDYPFLTACVYLSGLPWVCGLSSSIPLLLNTEGNFLVEAGIMSATVPVSATLGSNLNLIVLVSSLSASPILMWLLRPTKGITSLDELTVGDKTDESRTVAEEADDLALPGGSVSDALNNSVWLTLPICFAGIGYIGSHFASSGFDLNLNVMIFTFIMVGMACHRTPIRYVVAMRRACSNVSGIIFQYPFYAGIMGIIVGTGLAESIAGWLASVASVKTLPFATFIIGGVVNFAIPSAGGEWTVVGPSVLEAAKTLGADMGPAEFQEFIARLSMSVAYGETLTNALQPFFLLIILPVMGAGSNMQARDVMGHVILPFLCYFAALSIAVTWLPM